MQKKRLLTGVLGLCLIYVFLMGNEGRADTMAWSSPTPETPLHDRDVFAPHWADSRWTSQTASQTAQPTLSSSQPALWDDEIMGHRQHAPATATTQPVANARDDLQRSRGWSKPKPTNEPDLLSPDQALAELRLLQRMEASTPVPSPTTIPLPTGGAPTASPTALHLAPSPLPPLQVGPLLPGMPEYVVIGRTYGVDCATPPRSLPTERIRFVDYLRNVLPNEWVTAWPSASLDAGAIAVKQFAWYTIVIQRKWRSQGYPFDIVDNTCDQYFRDASADPRTDAAIQRTWGTVLMRNGVLLQMYFRDTEATCGGAHDCMGQVESAVLASAGQSTLQILARYFNTPGTGVLVTGAQLPAQLPPVPPAPPILISPTWTATPSPPPTPSPTASLTPTPMGTTATMPLTVTTIGTTPTGTTTSAVPTSIGTSSSIGATATPGSATLTTTAMPSSIGATATPGSGSATPSPTSPSLTSTSTQTSRSATPSAGSPTQLPPTPSAIPPTPTHIPPTPSLTVTPLPVVMPNLVGLGENQARAALAKLGVPYVVVDYQGRDRLGALYDKFPPYAVVSHTPPAGTQLRPGQVVNLGVRAP